MRKIRNSECVRAWRSTSWLYNEDYLQIVLRDNRKTNYHKCFHGIHLKNLPEYNKRWGWEEGNKMVKRIAEELQANYPETLLFRAYGNDFAMITKEHFELSAEQIKEFASIRDTDIEVEVSHVDLLRQEVYTVKKLEKLEISLSNS